MNEYRNAYLEALGIDRWVPRNTPLEEVVAQPAPVAKETRAPESMRSPVQPAATARPYQPVVPAADWGALREQVAACTACDLCKTRTQTVFGVGNTRAEWLVIGEAP